MKVKRHLLSLGFALVIGFFLYGQAVSAELKIGYVIPKKVLEQFEDYRDVMEMFARFQTEKEKELSEKENQFKEELEAYERQMLMYSEETKLTKQKGLQAKKLQFDQEVAEVYDQDGVLARKHRQLVSPIINMVNEVINRIGLDEGYDIIFNSDDVILYAKEEYDLSDQVLEEMRKESRKLSVTPDEKKETEDKSSDKKE